MRTTLITLSVSFSLLACGGNSAPANDPSQASPAGASTTSGVTSTVGPASPGDSSGATAGATETKPSSAAPASPMEGGCKSGKPLETAKDLDACMKSCQGLDDQVPAGSKCIPAKASCASQCNTKFKKP